ncbi:MAG: hypothetical protein R3233_07965 [Xanthomonadales bacterium]|nr:hypothetical protein [Xanthomonadales bacterium]
MTVSMTDFEVVIAYTEQVDLLFSVLTLVITILFSYLVGMFFIGKRLSLVLFWIISVLYFLVMYLQLAAVSATGRRAASLGEELVRRINSEASAIGWMNSQVIPANVPTVLYWFFFTALVLSIVFSVLRRREHD